MRYRLLFSLKLKWGAVMKEAKGIAIQEIVEEERIYIVFQPIITIHKNEVIGLEALVRGKEKTTGRSIPPLELFQAAIEQKLVLELDRLCRRKALEKFNDIHKENKEILLFLNIDNSIIHKVVGSNHLYNTVLEHKISPNNIVIEINEQGSKDMNAVKRFVDTYRKHGFLIALDDIGAGHSNLGRIALLKPDLLKIDRELIKDIHQDYYKRQVVQCLIQLGERIGAVVIAEGVESEDEMLTVLEMGAQMIQGYYIDKPKELNPMEIHDYSENIKGIQLIYREYIHKKMKDNIEWKKTLCETLEQIVNHIKGRNLEEAEAFFSQYMDQFKELDGIYLLNTEGIQLSHTITKEKKLDSSKVIFIPAEIGANQSIKPYYYHLVNSEANTWISEIYVSAATGNRCRTLSTFTHLYNNKPVVLCVDFLMQKKEVIG